MGLTSLLNEIKRNIEWPKKVQLIDKSGNNIFGRIAVEKGLYIINVSYYQGCNANDHIAFHYEGKLVHQDDLCCKGMYHFMRVLPIDAIQIIKSSGNCFRHAYIALVKLR